MSDKPMDTELRRGAAELPARRPPGYFPVMALIVLALAVLLYWVSRANYPLFHSIADGATVFIAGSVFLVVWMGRRHLDNHYYLFIAIAFLAFALLNFIHLIGNLGTGIFPEHGNLGPTFYIASRYMLGVSFLLAPVFIKRKVRTFPVIAAYLLVVVLVLVSVLYWHNFPATYIEGTGLTAFKVYSDYAVCLMLLGGLGLLLLNRGAFDARVLRLIVLALVFSMATGLAFTLYSDPYGITNTVGHFFQVASFSLLYMGFVETALKTPQDLLYRNLKESNESILKLNVALENMNHNLSRDIAARQKAEEALRTSEELNRGTLQALPAHVAVVNGQGRILAVNQAWADFARENRATEGVAVGVNYLDVCRRAMAAQAAEAGAALAGIEAVLGGQKEQFSMEYPCDSPNQKRWFLMTVNRLGGPQGGAVITHLNITERKQAEEALGESELRYRLLHENLRDAFVQVTMDGVVVAFNDMYCQMLGYSPEEVRGLTYQQITPERWHAYEAQIVREQIMARGYSDVYEKEYRRKDGTVFPVELRTILSRDKDGQPCAMWGIIRDISARKQAEAALQASHERMKKVLEVETVGVMFWDLSTGRMTDANETFLKMMGYSRREVEAGELTWQKLTPPEYVEASLGEIRKFQATGRIGPYEKEYLRKDGARQWLILAGSSLGGNVCVEFCVDIGARKATEEALRASEERLNRLYGGMNEGLAVHEVIYGDGAPVDFVITDVNPAYARITGMARETAVGKKGSEVYGTGSPPYLDIFSRVAASGVSETFETYFPPLGKHFLISVFSPGQGKFATVFSDITARVEAETAVREREEQFRVLTQNLVSAVALVNEHGAITIFNKSFLRLFELAEDADIINVNSRDWSQWQVFDEGGHLLEVDEHPVRKAARTRMAVRDALVAVQCPGQGVRKWVLISAEPILDAQGQLHRLICTYHDITARKGAEEALRQTMEELRRSNKELERFAYIASHDLQEPLRQVAGFGKLLEQRYGAALDEKGQEYMRFMIEGSQRMSALVKGLLDYSRVGRGDVKRMAVVADEVLEGVLANLRLAIEESGACVVRGPLARVLADPVQLGQVFQNLIGNAIKFRREGVVPEIEVGCRPDGEMCTFWVKDNGIGIPAELHEKVFVIFQRLHGQGKYPGTGIGLTICKKIVEYHRGRMWMESTVGVGSTFFFTLPLAKGGEG